MAVLQRPQRLQHRLNYGRIAVHVLQGLCLSDSLSITVAWGQRGESHKHTEHWAMQAQGAMTAVHTVPPPPYSNHYNREVKAGSRAANKIFNDAFNSTVGDGTGPATCVCVSSLRYQRSLFHDSDMIQKPTETSGADILHTDAGDSKSTAL